jgi:NAD(P)-dependent dehydrogenase (short-subunit alcohol dehydrogenase family)
VKINGASAIVTGGASGLGRATATRLAEAGAHVVLLDLPSSPGADVAAELGDTVHFVPADVTDPDQVEAGLAAAEERAPLRVAVNCAGLGGPVRLVDKEGSPGDLAHFRRVLDVNLAGTFNVASRAAARMARHELVAGERGVIVLTASVAAFEGQIGQAAYTASKAGVHGFTLCAARDLASKAIRVCTIAPGLFDTPMLNRLPQPILESLSATVPHPSRLGSPHEYARLALAIVENPMLNGETIRLDGAIRMAPR